MQDPAFKNIDFERADFNDFVYGDIFIGKISFNNGVSDLGAGSDTTPLLDFASEMYVMSKKIELAGHLEYEFAESSAYIYFDEIDGKLVISTNYTKDKIVIDRKEFVKISKAFLEKIINDFLKIRPEAKSNEYIKGLMRDIE